MQTRKSIDDFSVDIPEEMKSVMSASLPHCERLAVSESEAMSTVHLYLPEN